jgi:hypothetical protein
MSFVLCRHESVKELAGEPDERKRSSLGRGKSTVKRQLARNLLHFVVRDRDGKLHRIQVNTASERTKLWLQCTIQRPTFTTESSD